MYMYVKVHFVTLHSDSGHIMQRLQRQSQRIMGRHADLWCDRLLEAGSPSLRLFLSSPSCCAVYTSACFVLCNARQSLWWPSVFTSITEMSRRPSLSSHPVKVIFTSTWASLNLVVAKKWAQPSVPVWPLAYTVFLPLFKELNLIWVRCVVVCEVCDSI